jgi:hypothetical protein
MRIIVLAGERILSIGGHVEEKPLAYGGGRPG